MKNITASHSTMPLALKHMPWDVTMKIGSRYPYYKLLQIFSWGLLLSKDAQVHVIEIKCPTYS
jgi:hypothetical protein